MTLRLILARHGDTFNPGDRVVFVGASNDLPLTEKGRAQAAALGECLARLKLQDCPILCGPLQRTRIFAQIAAAHLTPTPLITVDFRLNELDYGLWAGLTNQEIKDRYGEDELTGWDTQSIWPQNAGWPESEAVVTSEVLSLVQEIRATGATSAVVVSSNGRLRYFLKSIPGAFEQYALAGEAKVRTGNICMLEFTKDKGRVCGWNISPKEA